MISRRNIVAWLGYLAVFLAGGLVYARSGFVELWGYYGFRDGYSFTHLLVALGVLSVLGLSAPVTARFSTMALHLALLFVIVPTLILYAFSGQGRYFLFVSIYAYALLFVSVFLLPLRLKTIRMPSVSDRCMMGILTTALLIIAGLIAYITKLKYFNLDILRVYEFRSEIGQELPRIFGYLDSWGGHVLAPTLTVLGLHRHRYGLALLGVLSGILLFSLTAHKSSLFFPLLAGGVYFAASYFIRMPKKTMVALFGALLICMAASFRDFHVVATGRGEGDLMGTLFYRRVFLVPALLNSFYLETFGRSERYWFFSDKMFTLRLMSRPSNLDIPHIIGERYFHNAKTGANTGWIGSGFAQMGLLGLSLYSIGLALYFRAGDWVTREHGVALPLAVLAVPVTSMITSSDFFTVLLTHGGALALLIVGMLRAEKDTYMASTESNSSKCER